ncbi:sodium:calcium antiporter [Streptomonospora nanhaiensis]|uniref:sodium:calcium antiporter n=1 Tax=Streptomonospora nanhaiensis TaxID=1323731 RepID=UPI001C390969|nr:sodium:calcium antiporter [Streptomonospora nanhaiensis]MBV2365884.1 sodium:calcium antiporter [Streptomonospora nanhaiensis]MBX9391897.1 sodium:calcium antiporter [Streptomonospora nanhaiensis]
MQGWPLWASALVMAAAAAALLIGGGPFTRLVDRLADRTGLGGTMAGIILVGAVTALPGLITSVLGAARGDAEFAMNNALGGIALQTVFIALADVFYRRANLEHAAASLPNLLAPIGLSILLSTVLLAGAGPQVTVLGVHPVSVLLVFLYWYWLRLSRKVGDDPMWRVTPTRNTQHDEPDPASRRPGESLRSMWLKFAGLAALVALTGYATGEAGLALTEQTGLSSGVVGAVVTGFVTSLPELVTVLYAVRIRALHLAIGDIIGGNGFDVLFLSASDVAYREGSLYGAMTQGVVLLVSLGIVLNLLVAAGLIRRQEHGIGFEGVAMFAFYALGIGFLMGMG